MSDPLLLVEDDPTFAAVLARSLGRRGIAVRSAATVDAALDEIARHRPTRAVLDLNLGGSNGLALIPALLAANPDCRIVVLTGYASIATAVEAIKLGATQYLAKPVDVDTLLAAFAHEAQVEPDAAPPEQPLSVDRLEWEHIQRVLQENAGNISATARALNMHRRTLQRKLAKRPSPGG